MHFNFIPLGSFGALELPSSRSLTTCCPASAQRLQRIGAKQQDFNPARLSNDALLRINTVDPVWDHASLKICLLRCRRSLPGSQCLLSLRKNVDQNPQQWPVRESIFPVPYRFRDGQWRRRRPLRPTEKDFQAGQCLEVTLVSTIYRLTTVPDHS